MVSEYSAGQVIEGPKHSYRLERELGRGGFGVTWLASRTGDGLACALKSLHFHRISEWKSWELFERETEVLRQLDHPNIPDYLDDFKLGPDPNAPDGLVLVQQYAPGRALSEAVDGGMRLDEGQMLAWLVQILDVLAYLHGLSPPVIHRDVTPKNILLGEDGKAWLVDFGTVQAAFRSASEISSTSAGTFGYAPMEQFVGAAFPASDLYGLGITVLAVASGKDPTQMPFSGVRVDVRALVDFDARLMLLLERMTEVDPERRLSDARVALEQLRPLLHRQGRGPDDAAMRRVRDIYQQERERPDRAAVSGEDLLPSERIREAGVRLAALGKDALGVPDLKGSTRYLGSAAIAASGALVAAQHHLLDVRTLQTLQRLPDKFRVVAISAGAETLVAENSDGWRGEVLHVWQREGGSYQDAGTVEVKGREGRPALSPDGRMMAVIGSECAMLYDTRSLAMVQRVEGACRQVAFSADGRAVVCVGDGRSPTRVLLGGGGEQQLGECHAVAFCADGRTAALLRDRGIGVGPVAEVLRGKTGAAIGPADKSWRHPAFSPDGRWLAAVNYSDDVIVVVDVGRREVIHTLRNPGRPDARVRGVEAIGFSPEGDRLLVCCDVHCNRFASDDEDCVAIWALPSGAYLGAIVLSESEQRTVLISASGFHNAGGKGGRRDKEERGGWRQPEAVRKALGGTPMAELIDETARAQLADLEARWAFLHDLQSAGTLDAEAPLPELVDATRGLTHVLDEVLRLARQAQAETPTFGGGDKAVKLTADQLRAAARTLQGRSPAELAVLHEELIARSEAAEARRARDLAPTRARRADHALRRRESPLTPALAHPDQGAGPGGRLDWRVMAAAAAVAVALGLYLAFG